MQTLGFFPGGTETLIVVAVFLLIVFHRRVPRTLRAIGTGLKEMKKVWSKTTSKLDDEEDRSLESGSEQDSDRGRPPAERRSDSRR